MKSLISAKPIMGLSINSKILMIAMDAKLGLDVCFWHVVNVK